jgi:hypothetical protein
MPALETLLAAERVRDEASSLPPEPPSAAPEAPVAAHEAANTMPPPVDDRFTAANAGLDARLASQKASQSRGTARGRGLELPGGFTLSPTAVRMLLLGIFLLLVIAAWVIMGGVARANEGKVARIPVGVEELGFPVK